MNDLATPAAEAPEADNNPAPDGATPPAEASKTDHGKQEGTAANALAQLREHGTHAGADLDITELPGFDDDSESGDAPFFAADETEDAPTDEADPPADETPAETPAAEEPATPPAPTTPKRIRLNANRLPAEDFAVVSLADREGIPLAEAERRLFPNGRPQQAAPETPATDAPQAETVEALSAQLQQLRKDRAAAKSEFNVEKELELEDQEHETRQRLNALKTREVQAVESHRQTIAEQEQQSLARAAEAFPDSAKEGTPLFEAISADYARLVQHNPAVFNDPEWAEALAAKHAARLGIAPATAAVVANPPLSNGKPAPRVVAAPVKPAASRIPAPAPGSASNAGPRAQPTESDIRAAMQKATPAELLAFIRRNGTHFDPKKVA